MRIPRWLALPLVSLIVATACTGSTSGGADKPFFRSLCLCPSTSRSSVSTSAPQPAAFARPIRLPNP